LPFLRNYAAMAAVEPPGPDAGGPPSTALKEEP